MALQGVPFFGSAPASTSAVQVKADPQLVKIAKGDYLSAGPTEFIENNENSFASPPGVERIKTESTGNAEGVSPVMATPAHTTSHENESDSGNDEDDAQVTSPDVSPKRTTSHDEFSSMSSSPPQVAVAVHFVGAPGRTCAHCRTVKTPLWRNGPLGPKTLCNACGIRFKLGKLQVSSNGQNLEPVGTKASAGGRKRPAYPTDAPRTPPRKLRQFARKAERFPKPFSQRFSQRPVKHREHATSVPRRTHLPILTNHDGALILLQLAGVF
mmetsp:Transcript_17511/g.38175  ORF Transcript_17511/g.38175 Transcript_17511/m.38175 type:complete len:269 (-) Transcript_17511:549-1355(-)|eukprot:CAMPEP_0118941004 /NCGR_PEP_ID=MMETSP1169-20130426/32848_1 /TAXON_ID=36882 /ORGANISM="Pyramimonas obovata, Strain CCMP722" /LENGTH=268 /DNA_ID=CAMNT_0006885653 /DNA_START=199 /DNA_END=1005 /DNA_ORIENTATION=-